MQAMIWVISFACVSVLLWLILRHRESEKKILSLGFYEAGEPQVSFPMDKWELVRQGKVSSKQYRNDDDVLLVLFFRHTGNMAIDIPSYLLCSNGLDFDAHYMSLMDEMDIQYGSRFRPRGRKLPEGDMNLYTFDDNRRLAEFYEFVSSHRRAASIEINEGEILVVVRTYDLEKGIGVIKSARGKFGVANRA